MEVVNALIKEEQLKKQQEKEFQKEDINQMLKLKNIEKEFEKNKMAQFHK